MSVSKPATRSVVQHWLIGPPKLIDAKHHHHLPTYLETLQHLQMRTVAQAAGNVRDTVNVVKEVWRRASIPVTHDLLIIRKISLQQRKFATLLKHRKRESTAEIKRRDAFIQSMAATFDIIHPAPVFINEEDRLFYRVCLASMFHSFLCT